MVSVSSNSTTTTVEDQPPLAVAAHLSLWCFNDQEQEPPLLLALPVPNRHQQTMLFSRSDDEDHPTPTPTALSLFPCAPRIQDYSSPTKNHADLAELIDAASSLYLSLFLTTKNRKTHINIDPKKPIKNHHRWDFDELIDAASSLSLSLPTKRKRLIIIGPKKVEEEEGVIAKKQKVAVDNHHQHRIHKRLSTSDVNLSSRLFDTEPAPNTTNNKLPPRWSNRNRRHKRDDSFIYG